MTISRYAIVTSTPLATLDGVNSYLPANYQAVTLPDGPRQGDIIVFGEDDHGWTLDGYVIPRLGSGMMFAVEVDALQVSKLWTGPRVYQEANNSAGKRCLFERQLKLPNLSIPENVRRLPRDKLRVLVPAGLERKFQTADESKGKVALCDPVEGTKRRRGCWWIVREFVRPPWPRLENTAAVLLDGPAVFVNEAGAKLVRNSERKDR